MVTLWLARRWNDLFEVEKFEINRVVAVPLEKQYRRLVVAANAVSRCLRLPSLFLSYRGLDDRLDLRFSVDAQSHPSNFIAVSSFIWDDMGNIIPKEILLHPEHEQLPLTYIHELGHCFDYFCIEPIGEFSSCDTEEFRNWRDAVHRSEAYQYLSRSVKAKDHIGFKPTDDQCAEEKQFAKDEIFDEAVSRDYEDYEIWARAFTQYIVTHEKNARPEWLKELLNNRINSYRNSVCGLYWTNEDFVPIRQEMEAIFKSRHLC